MELTPAVVRLPEDLHPVSVAQLALELDAAIASPAPAVALVGASDDTFCLGLAVGDQHKGAPATDAFSTVLATMHWSSKPLIAVVDGRAIGGGMGLTCACDWVVATERSTFALPELLWGLVPAIIWPVITDRMAPHVARQWTLTAHTRSAAEGLAVGLVDDLVVGDQLDPAVRRATRMLRRLDPAALVRLRSWARASRQQDLTVALRRGAAMTAEMMLLPEVRHRWEAFARGDAPWSA
jgi:enoyl-CoA hydratase/carnithine racemase